MASNDDCRTCGRCWWTSCLHDADYTIRDVELIRHGQKFNAGDIDLCAGHYKYARRTGHLNLDWLAVEQGMARQKEQEK